MNYDTVYEDGCPEEGVIFARFAYPSNPNECHAFINARTSHSYDPITDMCQQMQIM
jgi:hypothetical protein